MIEVEMLETSANVTEFLGIDWGSSATGTLATYQGFQRDTTFPLDDKFIPDGTSREFTFATLNATQLTAVLSMLKSRGDTKFLARPRVLALNNETARIEISADTAIGTSEANVVDTQTVIQEAERAETGITLEVTPQINRDGFIIMSIKPKVIRPLASEFFPGTYVDTHERSAETTVMVKDGESVVIGGLLKTDDQETRRKVPFLGDIPLLGLLFQKKELQSTNSELVIFITPHLIKEEKAWIRRYIAEREQERPLTSKEREIRKLLDALISGGEKHKKKKELRGS
jgi:type II secretory pathway component GspD/PulD (secretin)